MIATPRTTSLPDRADIAIIGGGILGLAIARELLGRKPDLRIAVLEREAELAAPGVEDLVRDAEADGAGEHARAADALARQEADERRVADAEGDGDIVQAVISWLVAFRVIKTNDAHGSVNIKKQAVIR